MIRYINGLSHCEICIDTQISNINFSNVQTISTHSSSIDNIETVETATQTDIAKVLNKSTSSNTNTPFCNHAEVQTDEMCVTDIAQVCGIGSSEQTRENTSNASTEPEACLLSMTEPTIYHGQYGPRGHIMWLTERASDIMGYPLLWKLDSELTYKEKRYKDTHDLEIFPFKMSIFAV